PLSQNRSACRSREQTGIGSVCAFALCCHPADLSLSTSLCTHGKNIGKLGTGKRRNAEYAEEFSMNVEVLWQNMRKRNMSCTFHAPVWPNLPPPSIVVLRSRDMATLRYLSFNH